MSLPVLDETLSGDGSFLPASKLRTRHHGWPVGSPGSGPNGTTFPRYPPRPGASGGPKPAARGSTCAGLNRWRLSTLGTTEIALRKALAEGILIAPAGRYPDRLRVGEQRLSRPAVEKNNWGSPSQKWSHWSQNPVPTVPTIIGEGIGVFPFACENRGLAMTIRHYFCECSKRV